MRWLVTLGWLIAEAFKSTCWYNAACSIYGKMRAWIEYEVGDTAFLGYWPAGGNVPF